MTSRACWVHITASLALSLTGLGLLIRMQRSIRA